MTTDLPPSRLNLLRVPYLLFVLGLGPVTWPAILDPETTWLLGRSVAVAMLGALALLGLLGLRQPVAMLPLLFFEMVWKTIWLLRVALPASTAGTIDADTTMTMYECLLVLVFPLFIPWRHVWSRYVAAPADAWRRYPAR
ncbi:hypothetical protein [Sandarakinorhabdus sp. DWP1-3-1]|uniref:hypothetical protein n=1 Tax=Sandarakinorhabdus sp. DWP1-3-1 TaxID=2804627 RepID=UPI003CFAFE0E